MVGNRSHQAGDQVGESLESLDDAWDDAWDSEDESVEDDTNTFTEVNRRLSVRSTSAEAASVFRACKAIHAVHVACSLQSAGRLFRRRWRWISAVVRKGGVPLPSRESGFQFGSGSEHGRFCKVVKCGECTCMPTCRHADWEQIARKSLPNADMPTCRRADLQ